MIVDKKILKEEDDELYKLIIHEFDEVEKETKTKKPGHGQRKKDEDEVDYSNADSDDAENYLDEPGEEKLLMTEEEKKFIDDTVQWLKTKENKDSIISRIWDVLVEEGPDSFYCPEQKKGKEVSAGQKNNTAGAQHAEDNDKS